MSPVLPRPDLHHIPGPPGPSIRHTIAILREPHGFHDRCAEQYGPVYRYSFVGAETIALRGADALQWAMEDRDGILSCAEGWVALAEMFPGGLMLRDGADHRAHRRIMQTAFRKQAMDGYLQALGDNMERALATLPRGKAFAFYPAIKALTLRIGAAVFLGLEPDDPMMDRVNTWLVRETHGAIGLLRVPGPATAFGRGLAAHRAMIAYLKGLIPSRRAAGGGDFFSQMCRAHDEDGTGWSDEDIARHFNFLLMAAHDTTASALTSMAWGITGNRAVSDAMRAEAAGLPDGPLQPSWQSDLRLTDRVLKEALRLNPPVLFMPRRLTADAEWLGIPLPRGAYVMTNPSAIQRDPAIFPDPLRFDPSRFERGEDKAHKYAWAPFGGGIHKCIGMHFAQIHARVFWSTLLRQATLVRATGAEPTWIHLPVPHPKDGLRVTLIA